MANHEEAIKIHSYELWENAGRPHGREIEFWLEAERAVGGKKPSAKSENQGEGNVTAAREYNKGTKKFIESGQVDAKAKEAAAAIDGPEGNKLRTAEKIAKSHSHGEDPALQKPARRRAAS